MKKIIFFISLFLCSCSRPIDETEVDQPENEQEEVEDDDKTYEDDIEWGPLS